MKRLATLLFCLLLAVASGCKKDDKDKGKTQPNQEEPAVEQPAPIADEDLPVPADFEAQAEADITADTYKAELDTLEKEISVEP